MAESAGRGGRPRDPTRDSAIIEATLALLGEVGYDGLTMDLVAARAGAGKATVYRRWSSKAELVVDAVSRLGDDVDLDQLPDTGSLRGDYEALYQPQTEAQGRQLLAIMGGLSSMLAADPAIAEAVGTALIEPFVASQRVLIRRALERGEVSTDVDVETVALVAPSMTAYRLIVQRQEIDVDQLMQLVDVVILPSLGVRPG